MSALAVETPESVRNPLDLVEEIVIANEWPFERAGDDELVVEIGGRWCDYRLFFFWQAEVSAMQFSCQLDMKVQTNRRRPVNDLLAEINGRMWVGHFDLDGEANTPVFRQTLLLRGAPGATAEQLEDLVEIGLSESDRFYPAFQFVIWGGKSATEAVAASLLDTMGEA